MSPACCWRAASRRRANSPCGRRSGAARTRLIGQLLVESDLLSLCWRRVRRTARRLDSARHSRDALPFDLPRAGRDSLGLDGARLLPRPLSIATGVLFGLAPSLGASRPDLIQVLRASGEAAIRGAPEQPAGRLERPRAVIGGTSGAFRRPADRRGAADGKRGSSARLSIWDSTRRNLLTMQRPSAAFAL